MKILLVLLWMVLPYLAVSQDRFPAYEEVVRHCFLHYREKGVPNFRLIKHPDGYKAVFSDDLTPVLIWSPEEKWIMPDDADNSGGATNSLVQVFDTSRISSYVGNYLSKNTAAQAESDRLPYYGYRGYYNDVIRVLEPAKEQLDNAGLHGLARAYSAAASALLHDNSSLADSAELFRLAPHLREEDLSFHQHWLLIHPQVVRELIRVNRLDEAISLADVLNSSFTETMAPRGSLWIPVVEQYAQCGRLTSARNLAKQIADNYSAGKLNGYDMRREASAIKRLNELALQYHFSLR